MRRPFTIQDVRVNKNFREANSSLNNHMGLQKDPHGSSLLQSDIMTKFPILDVRAYGAGRGGDDTTIIQAAINDAKGTVGMIHGNITEGRVVYFPKGVYMISKPILIYSGIQYVGDGMVSKIKARSTFDGDALFQGVSIANSRLTGAWLHELEFQADAGTGIAAFRMDSANSVKSINNRYENIYLNCPYGLIFDYYCQHDLIKNLYAYGQIEQILKLRGNNCRIFGIDRESGTAGTTEEPYVHICSHHAGDSKDIELEHVLLEGAGSDTKCGIKIEDADHVSLIDYWFEMNTSNGYCLDLENVTHMEINGMFRPHYNNEKVKLTNVQSLFIDKLTTRSANMAWFECFEIDSTSMVFIDTLQTMRGESSFRHDLPAIIDKEVLWTSWKEAPTGNKPYRYKPISGGHNLLQNGSFLAKAYKWAWSIAPDVTNEYIVSNVSPGNMGHFKWSAATNTRFYQTISIPAAWVGEVMTIAALVKVVNTGQISAWIGNTGITEKTNYPTVQSATGWQLFSMSHVHQNLHLQGRIGFRFVSPDADAELYIADVWYGFGYKGHTNPASFGSIDLGLAGYQNTITYDATAPTTGTWKKGDIVWNTAPVGGGAPGWMCTTAGSPGTWKAMANLGA